VLEKFSPDIIDGVEDDLLLQLPDLLRVALDRANDEGKLRSLLRLLQRESLLPQSETIDVLPNGDILVFSGQTVQTKDLQGIAKGLGIKKSRIRFYNYEQSKRFDYRKLEYASDICAIIIGAVPHKTSGTEDFSSLVESLKSKSQAGRIPARIRPLYAGNQLKITNSNFKQTLKELIDDDVIHPDTVVYH